MINGMTKQMQWPTSASQIVVCSPQQRARARALLTPCQIVILHENEMLVLEGTAGVVVSVYKENADDASVER